MMALNFRMQTQQFLFLNSSKSFTLPGGPVSAPEKVNQQPSRPEWLKCSLLNDFSWWNPALCSHFLCKHNPVPNSLIRHVSLPCRRRAHAEFTDSKCYQSCHRKFPNAAIYNCIMPSTWTNILSLGLSKHEIITMALLWLDLMKCGNTNNSSHVEHLLCVPSTVLSAFHDNIVNPPNTWWVGTIITPISRSTKRWSTMP